MAERIGPQALQVLSEGDVGMSDFAISLGQRRRLLQGHYSPLTFPVKPSGCEPGARYVLAWRPASAVVCGEGDDMEIVRTPRCPVWFLTVRKLEDDPVKRPDARWLVRFDVTDLRDPDVFLARGAGDGLGYGGADVLGAGPVPDGGWLDVHHREVRQFWQEYRADRVRDRRQERDRARRRRAA